MQKHNDNILTLPVEELLKKLLEPYQELFAKHPPSEKTPPYLNRISWRGRINWPAEMYGTWVIDDDGLPVLKR